jgi:hypothetical protein
VPDYEIDEQPVPRVFIEDRVVRVPPEAPPGQVRLSLGVYNVRTHERLVPKTVLKKRRRAVLSDGMVTVVVSDESGGGTRSQ